MKYVKANIFDAEIKYLILLFVTINPLVCSKVYLDFKDSLYITEERDNIVVSVVVTLSETVAENVYFLCLLSSGAKKDFWTVEEPGQFFPNQKTSNCTFAVINDNDPEGNETFTVYLQSRNLEKAVPGNKNATILILLNDDPHGFLGFTNPAVPFVRDEPSGIMQIVTFDLERKGGRIGAVGSLWKVVQSHDDLYPDISPYNGTVYFKDGESRETIRVEILPDNLPENMEIFTFRLFQPFGGVKILSNASETELRVRENDAPVHFIEQEIVFSEPEVKEIDVYRGMMPNGDRIGPIMEMVSVRYKTTDQSAIAGADYVAQEGVLTFEPGSTKKMIRVEVLSDPNPELEETFLVELYDPSPSIILSNPRVVSVVIRKNDNPNGMFSFNTTDIQNKTILLTEGLERKIPVIRVGGHFSNITVHWSITCTNQEQNSQFEKAQGNMQFFEGIKDDFIIIKVTQDDTPNEPEICQLTLTSASNGALLKKEENKLPYINLIVADSDNAYGVVEWDTRSAHLFLSTTPRQIQVALTRSGGTFGTVNASYSVKHFDGGQLMTETLITTHGFVLFQPGESRKVVVAEIRNDVFLKMGSRFVIALESVLLQESKIIKTSSPIMGDSIKFLLNITSQYANGEVGFYNAPVQKTVNEPSITAEMQDVTLLLMRDGTSVQATVFWRLRSKDNSFTSSDVNMMKGTVQFDKGENNASLVIEVAGDETPELDETFIVDLVNISGDNERLRSGATTATVTILSNDNPGGMFQFVSSKNQILSESASTSVDVIRTGGDLTFQNVIAEVINGKSDFSPYKQVLTFGIGERRKPFFLFPDNDDVPELDETFTVQLTGGAGGGGVTIGNITTFNVTILASDDPYGVVSFSPDASNVKQITRELKYEKASVSFQISRAKGLYGRQLVYWEVYSSEETLNVSNQVSPTSGVVGIDAGLNSANIVLNINQDKIPEEEQEFTVKIVNVTGGAVFSQPREAKVTILANDFAVTLSPREIYADEGDVVNVTIKLQGTLSHDVIITLAERHINTTNDDFTLVKSTITIPSKSSEVSIGVKLTDDLIPELQECFDVILESTTGDTVFYENYTAQICINPNDDAGGIFVFESLDDGGQVEEGHLLLISVLRLKGSHGVATVYWQARYSNGSEIESSELSQVNGEVIFGDGQTSNSFLVVILDDNKPELNEMIVFSLTNVTGLYTRIREFNDFNITILANDYPNGLFEINGNLSTNVFAEDFDSSTVKRRNLVYFERKMGAMFEAEILWRITGPNRDVKLFDLFLHGHKNNTSGTLNSGLQFKGDSCLIVPAESKEMFLPSAFDAFTLTFWFKTNFTDTMSIFSAIRKDGYVIFDLHIKDEIFLIQMNNHSTIYSVDVNNASNADWHFFAVSTNSQSIDVYYDGEFIKTSKTPEKRVGQTKADVYIGCKMGMNSTTGGFDGILKNVWVYERNLSRTEMKEIMDIGTSFNPSSGYLKFQKDQHLRSVEIDVLDDDVPESEMSYVVLISGVTDIPPAKQKSESAMINRKKNELKIRVLQSDYANGKFEIGREDCSIFVEEKSDTFIIPVRRIHSFFGRVLVSWQIVSRHGHVANTEFYEANGTLEFTAGEKIKNVTLIPFDDNIPERNESFVLQLVTTKLTEALSSNHSGATILKMKSVCNVTILKNDNIHGVLQIMSSKPKNMSYIPVRHSPLTYNIDEEIGIVELYVVRAQGDHGDVSVEWRTVGLNATSGNDFVESVGAVSLIDQHIYVPIRIEILDNNVPELIKTFTVILKNPKGGATVGENSLAYINIRPSDNALGIFTVHPTMIQHEEDSPFNLTILRRLGSLDAVIVYWEIENGMTDFLESSGFVVFEKGVHEKTIVMTPRKDGIPELDESYMFKLTHTQGGGTIDRNQSSCEISILPNDYPYGLFVFQSDRVTVSEDYVNTSLSILRTKGTYGRVRVYYETYDLAPTVGQKSYGEATVNVDYMHVRGFVDFSENEQGKVVEVEILDDDLPERDEKFGFKFLRTQLLHPTTNDSSDYMIGHPSHVIVVILKNDDANGILEFSSSSINVTELYDVDRKGLVYLVRHGGTFGKVSISFEVSRGTARISSDFSVDSFTITLEDGETNATVPVSILEDDVPEFEEYFVLKLLPRTVKGGAEIGSVTSCRIIILENDYPYGLIGFTSITTILTEEPSGDDTKGISVPIVREWGTSGPVKVHWELEPISTKDISLSSGDVGFLTGETEQHIHLEILPDDLPEMDEVVTLRLMSVTLGGALISEERNERKIIVLENDNPFGIVSFRDHSISVNESALNISIQVLRRGGTFGELTIYYRTMELFDESITHRAIEGRDYLSAKNAHVLMKDGSNESTITISLLNDKIPELDENFQVVIYNVTAKTTSLPGKEKIIKSSGISPSVLIGERRQVVVTVLRNDFPNGLFRMSLDMAGEDSMQTRNKLSLLEPSNQQKLLVQVHIDREQGTFGSVTVYWRFVAGYTVTVGGDISGPTQGNITFFQGETRKSITFTVNDDTIPEADEEFVVELYSLSLFVEPSDGRLSAEDSFSHGAGIDEEFGRVYIEIRANDVAGGLIGFQDNSLSQMVNEGDLVSLFVERSAPALGGAIVWWKFEGENSTQDFEKTQGQVKFEISQVMTQISVRVKTDLLPEVNERFQLRLLSVNSTGIDTSGAAELDPSASVAYIFVGASNNPHGVFELYTINDESLTVDEDVKKVEVRVVRQYGKLGRLQLFYKVESLPINSSMTSADLQKDLGAVKSFVILEDGEDTKKIIIPIVDDNIPETDEGFVLRLTSVTLLPTSNEKRTTNVSNIPPLIGSPDHVVIVIRANDGANGVLFFAPDSLNPTVDEVNQSFNLTVIRSQGTFGEVYCFYFLNMLTASQEDFHIPEAMSGGPVKLVFSNGQRYANITVHIRNDNITETIEQFEVGITVQNAVGNGGVAVGRPDRTRISIMANDDAHGVIDFAVGSRNVTMYERDDHSDSQTFYISRSMGAFGDVVISWQVLHHDEISNDVTPANGILTFASYDREQMFTLEVSDDGLPELEEHLMIQLTVISGGARLGMYSTATINIPANDFPHGVMAFQRSLIHTKESSPLLKVSVLREAGLYGTVHVDYETKPLSATGIPGETYAFGTEHVFDLAEDFRCSHTFVMKNKSYLMILSETKAVFYEWKGVFVHLKDFEFMAATQISSVDYTDSKNPSNSSGIILAASNNSHITVYIFNPNKTLSRAQVISIFGITDTLLEVLSYQIHLIVSIGISGDGSQLNKLKIYRWINNKFVETVSLYQTFHARSLSFVADEKNDACFLIVGNYYNPIINNHQTESYVYKWSKVSHEFQLYGSIYTNGILRADFYHVLSRGIFVNVVNEFEERCIVYRENNTIAGRFGMFQMFDDSNCKAMRMFEQDNQVYLILVSTSAVLYELDWQMSMFVYRKTLPFVDISSIDLVKVLEITVADENSMKIYQLIQTNNTQVSMTSLSLIDRDSDFINKNGRLTFTGDHRELSFFVNILKDNIPEDDETFSIVLSNPTNGAVLSPTKSSLEVVIMANDNAYGRIGFANSSLPKSLVEEDHDIAFDLLIIREFGTMRDVSVWYHVTKMHGEITVNDIYPSEGKVVLKAGEKVSRMKLYLTGDKKPETVEIFEVRLTNISTEGLAAGPSGATLNYLYRSTQIHVMPNDRPYGVFSWHSTLLVTTEENEQDSSVLLVIQREGGLYGNVVVSYETVVPNTGEVGVRERPALPYVDFVPIHANVTLKEGMHEVFILIPIIHRSVERKHLKDNDTKFNEVFFVNITSVKLLNVVEELSLYSPPVIDRTKSTAEIVVTEIVQSNGILQFLPTGAMSVDENIGTLRIPVVRQNGSEGLVGSYFELVFSTTTGEDVLPKVGTVSFLAGETSKSITLQIVDDEIPELEESFVVRLTKSVGGVRIGDLNEMKVTINSNDFPYGLIGFQSNFTHLFVEEGKMAELVVERMYGTRGIVVIDWSCDKRMKGDISATAGRIAFYEGEETKSIQFFVLDDNEPETQVDFKCFITNVSFNSVLNHNKSSAIVSILASDKPFGEYLISPNSRNQIVGEPMGQDYDGNFHISVKREVGQIGDSQISWSIEALANQINNTMATFSRISGQLYFLEGDLEETVELKVLHDIIPEESQQYVFTLHDPTDGAVLSSVPNSTQTIITVASSDNPFGVFSIMAVGGNSANELRKQESVGMFSLIIQRHAGMIGTVQVDYGIDGDNKGDVSPSYGHVIFKDQIRIHTVKFTVANDGFPELDEKFLIQIKRVTLLRDNVDFITNNGRFYVNTAPKVDGSKSYVNVTIEENDLPYGLIGFRENRLIVHEWEDVVKISVERLGGTFGDVNISFSYTPITAQPLTDFKIYQRFAFFKAGQNISYIEVDLVDDILPEQQESFVIDLHRVVGGGAALISRNKSRVFVVIETSDNPNGLIGIYNMTSSPIVIQNPLTNKILRFPISRLAGRSGEIQVTWEIERTVSSLSMVTEDLSPSSGLVVFPDGQADTIIVDVTAIPYGGPQEEEERFFFKIKEVTNGAAIDESASTVSIIIKKKGYPNGLFYVSGVIEPSSIIDEPTSKNDTLVRILVSRNFGRLGVIKVRWSVSSTTGDVTSDLRYNKSQTIIFQDNQYEAYIDIQVVNDVIAELNEKFDVRLETADQDGEIDENRREISFLVRENDNPYGVFYLPSDAQLFHLNTTTLTRSIHISVARHDGLFGTCVVNLIVTHTNLPPVRKEIEIADGESQVYLMITIPSQAFVRYGSEYMLKIINVALKNTDNDPLLSPQVDQTRTTRRIPIPEIAANSIVEMTASSRYTILDLTTQMASAIITRSGLYGTIQVPWVSGYPQKMENRPLKAKGIVVPEKGVVTIRHGSRTGTFLFKASIPDVIKQPYDYAVHLTSDGMKPSPNQNGWPQLGVNTYSVLEPHGIVQISSDSLKVSTLEGTTAELTLVRSYSTVGSIRVRYQTKISLGNNAATPTIDYVPVTSSVDFVDGEFRKKISIEILNDVLKPEPESEEEFLVELLSVKALSSTLNKDSPKLGRNRIARVFIQDDDNPYGTIAFTSDSRAVNVVEASGFLELVIERTGGAFSQSLVEVLTIGGGESWTQQVLQKQKQNSGFLKTLQNIRYPATASKDYVEFKKYITFPKEQKDGLAITTTTQRQKVTVDVYSDNLSEPIEEFIVLISNATGGAIIFQPHSYALISVKANGQYNGVVRFRESSAVLDEDGAGTVELVVMRGGSDTEDITVSWVAYSETLNLREQLKSTRGTVNLTSGHQIAVITISAVQDVIPEYGTWFFVNLTSVSSGAVIKNNMASMNVTMLESDFPHGKFAFDITSRYPVVNLGENEVELVVRRFNGSQNEVKVSYTSLPMAGVTRDGGILLNPAIEGDDFVRSSGVLKFNNGQTKSFIKVRLLTELAGTSTYPKTFNVTLENPTAGAVLSPLYRSSRVIISNKASTGKFLKLRGDLLSVPLTDTKIVDLLTSMLKDIQSDLTEDEHQLSRTTIETILNYKSSLPAGQKALPQRAKDLLLDILNELMSTKRTDTLGHSYWVKLYEKTAFGLSNDWSCPTRETFSRSNFDLTVERQNKTKINGVSFGSDGNSFRFPINMYADSEAGSCTDIQFSELKNAQWFSGANSVLNNKVFTAAFRSGSMEGSKKVVYRIQAPQNRIVPTGVSCAIWIHSTSTTSDGSWSSSRCKINSKTQKYVECECNHMSEYAVLARSDDRTGYEIYFFVSCFVTIGACFLALSSHHLCAVEKTFPSKLLMHTFFAVMIANVIYVLGAYLSPRLIHNPEKCGILGIFLHFAFLSQFTTIFVQACNLWKILILNDEHSYRKAIPLYVTAWGIPILIIVSYFFITHAVWDWSLTKMYGDVHSNGDLCFIPHAYAAFSVAVIPVLLFLLGVVVVLIQAYQVTPQWKCYDDIYRGRYNIKEVKHLMVLFCLVTLTWVFAGFHIVFGHLWMVIAFTFFNAFTGLDILLVYVILRNQMRYTFKGKYEIKEQHNDTTELPRVFYQQATDNVMKKEGAEEDLIMETSGSVPVNLMPPDSRVRRSVTPLSQKSPYSERSTNPVTSYRFGHGLPSNALASERNNIRRERNANTGERQSDYRQRHNISRDKISNTDVNFNDSYEHDDLDSTDFDDLIFALKTGGNFTPSIHEEIPDSHLDFDDQDDNTFPEPPSMSERYSNVRRIKMGDTPL